jgi:hypothetical protein
MGTFSAKMNKDVSSVKLFFKTGRRKTPGNRNCSLQNALRLRDFFVDHIDAKHCIETSLEQLRVAGTARICLAPCCTDRQTDRQIDRQVVVADRWLAAGAAATRSNETLAQSFNL